MIVDSHQHFWNPARGDYFWMVREPVRPIARTLMPVDLKPHLLTQGIAKTVLVQAAPTIHETEFMLGIADTTQHVAKVVGWVEFENRDDLKQLRRLKKHPKFAGVRPMIQDLADPEWMHREDVQWAFEALIDLDLTFDALGFPIHLDPFQRLFDRYPSMRTVIDHCMKPIIRDGAFKEWASKIEGIAKSTSVLCKLSGLATEANAGWTVETLQPYVAHVLKCFGPKRLMWGSDWPVLELNGTYDRWFETAKALVPVADHAQIFGKTAAEFYGIDAL